MTDGYGLGRREDGGLVIDWLRAHEFDWLDGATLYARSQVEQGANALLSRVVSNPHSTAGGGDGLIQQARRAVLAHFNVNERTHRVVWTSGATHALRLVAECFPWTAGHSRLRMMLDNHTSVLGMRQMASELGGACVEAVESVEEVHEWECRGKASGGDRGDGQRGEEDELVYHLLAYPGESNFSGVRYDLDLARRYHEARGDKWLVLLDAAKLAATAPLDLSRCQADFVTVSFYKMVGWPTGLGALIVRNEVTSLLQRRAYFGGGTVEAVLASEAFVVPRRHVEARLEDGTLPFLSVQSLLPGLRLLQDVGMEQVARHTAALREATVRGMKGLKHGNGAQVCEVYDVQSMPEGLREVALDEHGPVVAFNVKGSGGEYVGYGTVDKFAASSGIRLRTGCFCNAGACQLALGLDAETVKRQVEEGHVCWDDRDVIDGVPTGAVRISFGYMSTMGDVERWLEFVKECFVVEDGGGEADVDGGEEVGELCTVQLFPIKSCGGMVVDGEWPLGARGLEWDREWALFSAHGSALSQKRVPGMARVRASVDVERRVLVVRGLEEEVEVGLDDWPEGGGGGGLRVCGSKCEEVVVYEGDGTEEWFSKVVGQPCRLGRIARGLGRNVVAREAGKSVTVGFANEGQYLLVNEESARQVGDVVGMEVGQVLQRFRPNFVVRGFAAWAEEEWRRVRVGECEFEVIGPCVRCTVVDVDQATGEKTRLFAELGKVRRRQGKVVFGVLLQRVGGGQAVRVGDEVVGVR